MLNIGAMGVTAEEADERGIGHVDFKMAVSSTIAMVSSMALLDDLVFSSGSAHLADEQGRLRRLPRDQLAGLAQTVMMPLAARSDLNRHGLRETLRLDPLRNLHSTW
jgi:hypothetical protein